MLTEFRAHKLVWNLYSALQEGIVARWLKSITVLVIGKYALLSRMFMDVWEPRIQGTQKTYFIPYLWSAPTLITAPKLNEKFKVTGRKYLIQFLQILNFVAQDKEAGRGIFLELKPPSTLTCGLRWPRQFNRELTHTKVDTITHTKRRYTLNHGFSSPYLNEPC